MDKKTVKVIEKYSMPFVQLVIEKGEEDSIFSDLTQIKQVAEETDFALLFGSGRCWWVWQGKTVSYFQDSASPLLQNFIQVLLYNHRSNLFYDVIVDCLNRLERETNRFEVTIMSAHPLTDEQKERLLPIIEKKMSLKVRSIKEEIDDSFKSVVLLLSPITRQLMLVLNNNLKLFKENLK